MTAIPKHETGVTAQGAHALPAAQAAATLEPCCSSEELIGARLRLLRRKRNLSIRALEATCGLSANTHSLNENGHTSPSVHSLELLALAREMLDISATLTVDQARSPEQWGRLYWPRIEASFGGIICSAK
jgi:DNA-binding transcriptional regulator YiaG